MTTTSALLIASALRRAGFGHYWGHLSGAQQRRFFGAP
jgi:hypothetical protein